MIGRARTAIVLVVSPQRVQGSALRGHGQHETESPGMLSAPMGHADLMARAAMATLQVLPSAVLVPGVMVQPVLTAVRGRPVIANLARTETTPLAIMIPLLTLMRFQRSLTVLHGVN